jgi:hypothetical protein
MTWQRFDRLLKAMTEGEKPSRKTVRPELLDARVDWNSLAKRHEESLQQSARGEGQTPSAT